MGVSKTFDENPQHVSRVMSLADELILNIIEHIDDIQSLRAFILTCQKAQNRAEPYLWRDIILRDGDQARRFFTTIMRAPERTYFVQSLDIKYQTGGRDGVKSIVGFVSNFQNLRSWTIESPCPNDNLAFSFTGAFTLGEGLLRYWEDVPKLNFLEEIRLHTHIRGGSYFDLSDGKGAVIFKSPSLRFIHLACTDITPHSVRLLQNCEDRTPLETLVFEECNIDADALSLILSRPKALKRLTLGERLHHFHTPTSGYLPESGIGVIHALRLQANSLEYLKQTQQSTRRLDAWPRISDSDRRRAFCSADQLPDFPALQEIDLPFGSPLAMIIANSPPRLEKIRLHQVYERLLGQLIVVLITIPRELNILDQPSVNHVELVLNETLTVREDTQDEWLETLIGEGSITSPWRLEQRRTYTYELGRRLAEKGIRLTVNWIRSAGYIAPYMDGEILPTEFTIYDSNHKGIFGHIESGKCFRDEDCERRLKMKGLYHDDSPSPESVGGGDSDEELT